MSAFKYLLTVVLAVATTIALFNARPNLKGVNILAHSTSVAAQPTVHQRTLQADDDSFYDWYKDWLNGNGNDIDPVRVCIDYGTSDRSSVAWSIREFHELGTIVSPSGPIDDCEQVDLVRGRLYYFALLNRGDGTVSGYVEIMASVS